MFPVHSRILVVDDFATMRKIIKKVLQELGFHAIQEADDGKPALELLKSSVVTGMPFDLIISDWNMPGLSGLELLKAVKGDPNLRHIPFILVTAESEQKNIIEAAKNGVSDYVVKPFNAETLKQKLERVHRKHFPAKVAS